MSLSAITVCIQLNTNLYIQENTRTCLQCIHNTFHDHWKTSKHNNIISPSENTRIFVMRITTKLYSIHTIVFNTTMKKEKNTFFFRTDITQPYSPVPGKFTVINQRIVLA